MKQNDIIITGPPRSGTTLVCNLLNQVANTAALHEPIGKKENTPHDTPEVLCDRIDHFFKTSRASLIEKGIALSKQNGRCVPDNPKAGYPWFTRFFPNRLWGRDRYEWLGLRKSVVSRGEIKIDKPLSENFTLCIKHNGYFTALLKPLRARYRCYAVIRNPLAVLASWNSIHFSPRQGRLPAAENVLPNLSRDLNQIEDRLDRQIHLLTWLFKVYQAELRKEQILTYEEIIESRGTALQIITTEAKTLNCTLKNKNTNQLYNRDLMKQLGEKLLMADKVFWHYYKKESVKALMKDA